MKKEIRNYCDYDIKEEYAIGYKGNYITTFANKKFAVIKIKNNGKKYELVRADNLTKKNILLLENCRFIKVKELIPFGAYNNTNPDTIIDMIEVYFEHLDYLQVLKLLRS